MKIRIEMNDEASECEVIIRCKTLNEEVLQLQGALEKLKSSTSQFVLYKGETEYYLDVSELLFFETEGNTVNAHTVDNVFQTKYKLYELEEMLPRKFVRISKSTIVNSDKIYSIHRNLTASSLIELRNTHKQIYVSRSYYKMLKTIMALHSLYEITFPGFYTGIAIVYYELSKMINIPFVSIPILVLAVILLSIGTSLLVPSNYIYHIKEKRMQKYKINDQDWENRAEDYDDPDRVGKYQTVENRDNENYAYGKNSFGATSKYITMNNLQGATLECSFGELKAYFDGSTIITPPIDITVHCNFGSIELYIPKEWNINPMVKVSLGNIEEKNRHDRSDGPVVNLMGSVSFGSVQIIYV